MTEKAHKNAMVSTNICIWFSNINSVVKVFSIIFLENAVYNF